VLPNVDLVAMWLQEDPCTCKFIRSEEQYERYVRGLDAFEGLQATCQVHWHGEDGNAELERSEMATLKQELDLVKQQLHVAAMDISNLKMQRIENKVLGFGMDTSVAVALCVGVVIGMLVNAMCWCSDSCSNFVCNKLGCNSVVLAK
jgi:hypothetical protein